MRAAKFAIVFLLLALIASNAFWLYLAVDAGVSRSYREVVLRDYREALSQALAILPIAAAPGATPERVVAAAAAAVDATDSFEKEGFIWVGSLGLKFGRDGRLVEAAAAWSPY